MLLSDAVLIPTHKHPFKSVSTRTKYTTEENMGLKQTAKGSNHDMTIQ